MIQGARPMAEKLSDRAVRAGALPLGRRMPVDTAPPPIYHCPSPWWTNIREAVASISGILHTRMRNIVSWYMIMVTRMDTAIAMASGMPYHRYMLTNT